MAHASAPSPAIRSTTDENFMRFLDLLATQVSPLHTL
jgi:hypothetical protein